MKIVLSILLLLQISARAQIISRFTWTSTPLTNAVNGPNGSSVSAVATTRFVGGAVGYAISPGTPTTNLDLVVPGSPYFDVPSIDIQLYFRREESVASFFKRGALFDFGISGGYLTVTFTTTQGSTPGNITINSGNITTVANDHAFHLYRFNYDNNTGVARVWVDNVLVYTYTGVAGRPMDWTSAGNVIIGQNMDATTTDIPILGDLIVQNGASAMLPINLVSFTGAEKNNKNVLNWSTSNESGFSHFEIERSADGVNFSKLQQVKASTTKSFVNNYQAFDDHPLGGANYYRLKLVDNDNAYKYSAVIKIGQAGSIADVACYPNPATNFTNLILNNTPAGTYSYSVSTIQGNIVKAATLNLTTGAKQIRIDLSGNIPSGVLVIRLSNQISNSIQTFRIVKG